MRLLVFVLVFHYVDCSGLYKCPKQEPMKDFDVTKIVGRWYEVERTFYLWELYTKCLRVDATINKPGQIHLSALTTNRLTGNQKFTEGVATESRREPSIYQVRVSTRLPKSFGKFLPGSATYQVLYTDYNNFAVIWSCSSYSFFHYDRVWILGRKWDISVDLRAKIYHFLSSHHIDTDRLLISSRDCNM